jgi:hypothetical protein
MSGIIEITKITVKGLTDVRKLVTAIPSLTRDIGLDIRCVPVLSTGSNEQLYLVQNGKSIMNYRVEADNKSIPQDEAGMTGIEKFIDRLDGRKHLVVLYDESNIARSLEFRYLKTGLEDKGQQCIYVFAEDDVETPESIKKQMENSGIDAQRYMKDGLLKFVRIEDPSKDPKGFLAGALKNVEKISREITKTPVRVIAHQKYRFNTDTEIRGEYDAEYEVESGFEKFPGSLLCNHYLGNDPSQKRNEWTRKMIETHDNVILVTSSSPVKI